MAKPVRNMGASVRARLVALARDRRQPLDLLLTRFALERVLYRALPLAPSPVLPLRQQPPPEQQASTGGLRGGGRGCSIGGTKPCFNNTH